MRSVMPPTSVPPIRAAAADMLSIDHVVISRSQFSFVDEEGEIAHHHPIPPHADHPVPVGDGQGQTSGREDEATGADVVSEMQNLQQEVLVDPPRQDWRSTFGAPLSGHVETRPFFVATPNRVDRHDDDDDDEEDNDEGDDTPFPFHVEERARSAFAPLGSPWRIVMEVHSTLCLAERRADVNRDTPWLGNSTSLLRSSSSSSWRPRRPWSRGAPMTRLALNVMHDAIMKTNADDDHDDEVAEEEEQDDEELQKTLHSRSIGHRSEFVVDEGATVWGVSWGCAARRSADSEGSASSDDEADDRRIYTSQLTEVGRHF